MPHPARPDTRSDLALSNFPPVPNQGMHDHVESRFGALSDMRGEQERQWQAALEAAHAFTYSPEHEADQGTGSASGGADNAATDEERQVANVADSALDAALTEE